MSQNDLIFTNTADFLESQKREYFEHQGLLYDCTWEDDNQLIRHGGPWDRGSADSYYRRGSRPHFYPGATGASDRILQAEMSEEQVLEYLAGYAYNEEQGDYKEY